jgi:inosine-uridine nucleoside N-ribohydrolase
MFFIDADNAMGSPSGDVDDAFAIAGMVRAGAPIAAISSVDGNTSEPLAFQNNRTLCTLLGYSGPLLRAREAVPAMTTFGGRLLALGPLTNVAAAKPPAAEIILVGGNSVSRGRWPPLWPHEFNLTKDRAAARAVFAAEAPLTIFPLNVARELWVRAEDLQSIGGELGAWLRKESARWFKHLMRVRLTGRFPIYDLAAALYALDPAGFTMDRTLARMHGNTYIEFDAKDKAPADAGAPFAHIREVTVCRGLRRRELWQRFLSLLR